MTLQPVGHEVGELGSQHPQPCQRVPGLALHRAHRHPEHLGGRPLLGLQLERMARLPGADVVVATSVLDQDDPVAALAADHGVACVRGPEDDVLARFAMALAAHPADEVVRLTAGCAVIATGVLVPSQGKGQSFEIQASKVEVVGWVDDPETYPIQPKAHTMEYLREVAHLRPRTNTFGAIARVRHCIAQAVHRYFTEREFFWVNTPIITASDAEGAGQCQLGGHARAQQDFEDRDEAYQQRGFPILWLCWTV